MIGPQKAVAAMALLTVLLAGAWVWGYTLGRSQSKTSAVRSQLQRVEQSFREFSAWVDTANKLAISYQQIAEKAEQEKQKARTALQEIRIEGTEHAKATGQTYTVDPVLHDLRLCAYDVLYQAANAALPEGRENSACASFLPDKR